jgi:hypothetical protein
LALMRIKLSYYFTTEPLLRQTPGGLGFWKSHQFIANDPEMQDPDIWVVLEDVVEEERAFPKLGRTVLLALEPPRTRDYRQEFLAQFDLVVSCHRGLRHPNVRNEYQGQQWHIGLHKGADATNRPGFRATMSYDDFQRMPLPRKEKALSAICSVSKRLPGHRMRSEFVEKLQARLGDRLDLYGRGVRPIPDKADAIIPYRYHISLENSRLADYWTEKLSDSYLGWAFPIYWGCPNISDYFPENSLIQLDIDRPDEAIDVIEATMDESLSPERLAGLRAARELVLDRYNTFDVVRRACESLAPARPREAVIRPQSHFRPSKLRRNAKRALQKVGTLLRGERW